MLIHLLSVLSDKWYVRLFKSVHARLKGWKPNNSVQVYIDNPGL